MNVNPKIFLFKFVEQIIKQTHQDTLNNSGTPEKSMLFRYFGKTQLTGYNLFEQSKAIFTKNENSNRRIEVNMGFNLQRATVPTIHIIRNNEVEGADTSIGKTTGGYEEVKSLGGSLGEYKEVFKNSYSSKYDLLITSDKDAEIEIIHDYIRSVILAYTNILNCNGLENVQLSSQDINLSQEFAPTTFFSTILSLSFFYKVKGVRFEDTKLSSKLNFNFNTVESFDEEQ